MEQVYYTCVSCSTTCVVTGRADEMAQIERLLGMLPQRCFTHRCRGTMERLLGPAPCHYKLTVHEFIAALAGLGVPEDTDASFELVESLLSKSTVTRLTLSRSSHTKRTILTALELSSGITLHLAISPEGPTIYKITGRHNGRSADPKLQENPEDVPLRLGSDEDAGAGGSGGDHGPVDRGGAGEPASSSEGTPRG